MIKSHSRKVVDLIRLESKNSRSVMDRLIIGESDLFALIKHTARSKLLEADSFYLIYLKTIEIN